jgi:hypothetical protein
MGAGVKPGFSYGATDELGWKAVQNKATLYVMTKLLTYNA